LIETKKCTNNVLECEIDNKRVSYVNANYYKGISTEKKKIISTHCSFSIKTLKKIHYSQKKKKIHYSICLLDLLSQIHIISQLFPRPTRDKM